MTEPIRVAHIVGAGPNGLAAAIVLAQAGLKADVYEAEAQPGGACRTMELTLPGFRHDFGSAVHPLAAASPFFSRLPLARHGLKWIDSPAPLAHPMPDGTAVMLERDLGEAERALETDGPAWRSLVEPIATHWPAFCQDALAPILNIPHHPLLMAQFGFFAMQPALGLARGIFISERARALFGGLAAHSFLSLDQPLSSAIAIVLGASAHVAGWPVPGGGSQSIVDALVAQLIELGGSVHAGTRIDSLEEFGADLDARTGLVLCDQTPRQLLAVAGTRLRPQYRRSMRSFRYGPAAFKIDYALSQPIPWRAKECNRAICLHVCGTLEEIAESESAIANDRIPERPFLLVAQPSLYDSTRAPEGKHVAWVYCHVPNGCPVDMTDRVESQLERFAPGFRDCVLARSILNPAALEARDANLVGGDINGGELSLRQFLVRPAIGNYFTGTPGLFLCSASTPPGGGVHGMCGYHAARMALRMLRRK